MKLEQGQSAARYAELADAQADMLDAIRMTKWYVQGSRLHQQSFSTIQSDAVIPLEND
ncbi:MAG: hypothetical protein ACLTDV_02670 [Eubacterium sp.]